VPGECSKAGILDHVGQRRCGMMTDNRMQRHLGEAHLPKRVKKLREILFGFVAHPGNSDAVEQLRMFANRDCRKAQLQPAASAERRRYSRSVVMTRCESEEIAPCCLSPRSGGLP
jgi:hypothetical protein